MLPLTKILGGKAEEKRKEIWRVRESKLAGKELSFILYVVLHECRG